MEPLVRWRLDLRAALARTARLEGDAAADDRAGVGGDPVGRRAGAPGPGAAGHSKRAREDLAKKASAAFELAQSEVGRSEERRVGKEEGARGAVVGVR